MPGHRRPRVFLRRRPKDGRILALDDESKPGSKRPLTLVQNWLVALASK
jgi:hypothetical protein